MTDKNKNIDSRLPPWHKKSTQVKSYTIKASPLVGTSHRGWKPYFMNHFGAGSSGTTTSLEPSDGNVAAESSNDDNKTIHSQSEPSDDNTISDGDVATAAKDSLVQTESAVRVKWSRQLDPNTDPKKLKRIISNRLSAQKSRMKKLQYISDMERQVKALEAEIAVLSPQLAFHQNQQKMLKMENAFLNQQLTSYKDNSLLKDVQLEENRAEVTRLRQLHMTQQQQVQMRLQGQTTMTGWEPGLEQMANLSSIQPGLDQMTVMNVNQGGIEGFPNINSRNLNPYSGFM